MKKINLLALSLSSLFLLTGCGKTLTCTFTEREDGVKYEETWKIKYKEDEIKKIKIINIAQDNKEFDDEILEAIEEDIEEYLDELEDEKGIKITIKEAKNKYEVLTKIDTNKASKNTIDYFYEHKMDIDELEEYLEYREYKCK